jgi:hypothetical protein
MTSEKSFKPRKRANGQDRLRALVSLEYQQIVPETQTSARNHSKGNWQRLLLGLLISGGLSASAQEQKAPRATLVATPTPTSAPIVVTGEDYDGIPPSAAPNL